MCRPQIDSAIALRRGYLHPKNSRSSRELKRGAGPRAAGITFSTIESMTPYREFPDPVIATYLQTVRALPVPTTVARRRAHVDDWRSQQRVWTKIIHRCVTWLVAATVRMSIASATWTVKDPSAKAVYRSVVTELRKRGWPNESTLQVVNGLTALRSRDITRASGDRLYRTSMESIVPRETIGWI